MSYCGAGEVPRFIIGLTFATPVAGADSLTSRPAQRGPRGWKNKSPIVILISPSPAPRAMTSVTFVIASKSYLGNGSIAVAFRYEKKLVPTSRS